MSQFQILPYTGAMSYQRYDVVQNLMIAGTVYASPSFTATNNIPAGNYSPSGVYNYPITAYSRFEDVTTLTFSHTGGLPFGAGDVIKVTGMVNGTVNYTGMVIEGGSGTLKFINPGFSVAGAVSVGAISCSSPSWSTGFCFAPDYTTKMPSQNKTIVAQLGDGYSQRAPLGLNPFDASPSLVFRNIDGRQAKAIVHYVQDNVGVYPTQLLIPTQYLSNNATDRYVLLDVSVDPVSYNRFDCTVSTRRVFDPA